MVYNYINDLEGAESVADTNPDTDAFEEEVDKNQLDNFYNDIWTDGRYRYGCMVR